MIAVARIGLAAVLFCELIFAPASASPCGEHTSMMTNFGDQKLWANELKPLQQLKLSETPNTRYLRILLRATSNDPNWNLVVRDRAGRPLQSIAGKSQPAGTTFWTDRLFVNDGAISLESDGAPNVKLAETIRYTVVLKSAENPYYSIQGAKESWVDVYAESSVSSFLRRKAESVGMFIGSDGDSINGSTLWTCSGFVVRSDSKVYFVTNDHCGHRTGALGGRWNAQVCTNSTVDFSWDGDAISRDYFCERVVVRSDTDDLAVLELRAKNEGEAPPKALPLKPLEDTSAPLAIIQHPASESKKVSRGCSALTTEVAEVSTIDLKRDFAHRCDTAAGSSGAPVLDEEGNVVGIHHLAFEKLSDGRCDRLNKAIRVERLITLLATVPTE
ncbi:trypsin-like serine peptidase [Bradyrhizobium sp. AZCC 2289]|uniref:trypsin-like serine peptidase n=1 Tax=Bradyrhizobium sp. AZCC 2289 TaxID=3117026 RepID=UPI002FF00CEC